MNQALSKIDVSGEGYNAPSGWILPEGSTRVKPAFALCEHTILFSIAPR